jgi:DNA-binding NarL/FixJ family response regulator
VDDHPVVRTGIRKLLEKADDIQVVGEAGCGHEALRLVRELVPDILILDMELPDIKGYEVIQQMEQAGSSTRVLVLSAYDRQHYVQKILASGASGYLIKDEMSEMILDAVHGIARGEQGWFSRKIVAQASASMQAGKHAAADLTTREVEVLRAVTAGKTNQEIAVNLGISVKTVEKHMDKIFTRLGVASRLEAAIFAVEKEII